MTTFSWNCHGLGTPWALQFLKDQMIQKKPSLIFISETLCKKEKAENIRRRIGFEGAFGVDCQGQGGGLVMFWRNKEDVTVQSYSINHIDVLVNIQGLPLFRLTGLYGEPDRAKRRSTWNLIRQLYTQSQYPWVIIGDMNNVLGQADKKGGPLYPSWLINGFQEVIEECDLHDMDLIGYPFTWERGYGTDKWVEIRLDRALASSSWLNTFKAAKLSNVEVSTSDHCPILLEPVPVVSSTSRIRKLRFENAWLREPVCKNIVENSWNSNRNEALQTKLSRCLEEVSVWGQEFTGNFKKRIYDCQQVIRRTKGRRDRDAVQKNQKANKELTEILTQQEIFWKQRSKQLWLREGDRNSKYFHASARTRRKNNQITFLINDVGEQVEWEGGLQELMIDYFKGLFAATESNWQEVIRWVDKKVTGEHNDMLLQPVESQEVKQAIFHMHPDKSPGPDGMSPGFYQKYWSIVGNDVSQMVKSFFDSGKFDDQYTDTNIVLIPKKKNPQFMVDLRPISLCNVRYKIVSKVLANRLKGVIDHIISEEQSAFIPGRIISDNIMVSYEIIHYMKRKTQGKRGWMALKLDMSKAYDRVEWNYIRAMLAKLGFNHSVINLFMQCVSSARYKITHSGKEFGNIVPQRGLRQGDPLSSYLFLVCMEGLSAIIKSYERRGLLKGIKVARGAPSVSHMFFADDSYIYCHATREEAVQVMGILAIFEQASGQKINIGKSSVFFSSNVKQEVKSEVMQVLGFHEADLTTQYLGLPNCIGRNKTAALGYLKDRVRNRIQSWDEKWLNKSAKEVLLKTVTQAIPTYAMSVFLLPIELCRDMEKLMCQYWWKTGKKDKNIHWMSWERMSVSKMYGGMGFRNLHEFNVALLGKQGWRLVTNSNSLVARVFRAKYYPRDSFMSAKLGSNPSYVWRSVLAAQDILRQGLGCRVGDGSSINIVKDPWLPSRDNPYVMTNCEAIQDQKVSSLMLPDERRWDEDLVKDIFIQRDAAIILATPLSESSTDIWYWRRENSGSYSVKSAYVLIQEAKPVGSQLSNTCFWKRLWNLTIPPKVKNFMWRAISGCLPTKDLLVVKHVNVNVLCSMCNRNPETTSHILLECSFAKSCWEAANIPVDENIYDSFQDWSINVFNTWGVEKRRMGSMICWSIWRCRNDLTWNQKCLEAKEAAISAKVVLSHWKEAQDNFFDRSWGLVNQNDGDERWTMPTENQTKVNTDAAVFESSNRYSYAFAARNHKGDLVEAHSSCKEGRITPDCAEAMGIREALSWIKLKRLENVVVETDSLVAVQAIRGSIAMRSYFGAIVQECRDLASLLKDKGVILKFVKRSANNLAHALASCSYSIADRIWRANDACPEIIDVLRNDLIQ